MNRKKSAAVSRVIGEKQIAEAEKDIEEKGKDTQTEKDRIDESVGEQERRDGDENSQDAKDRVDESEGETKAEDNEEIEKHEEEDAKKIPEMIREILREELKPILSEALKEYGLNAGKTEKEASDNDKKALAGIESIYNS